jgi:hypothetical protein
MTTSAPTAVRAFETRTVQKGRMLPDVEAVKKRLKEIRDNPKSSYHQAYKNGDLAVLRSKYKTKRTTTEVQYDIVEIVPLTLADAGCGNCGAGYLNLEDDYLCPSCRSEI